MSNLLIMSSEWKIGVYTHMVYVLIAAAASVHKILSFKWKVCRKGSQLKPTEICAKRDVWCWVMNLDWGLGTGKKINAVTVAEPGWNMALYFVLIVCDRHRRRVPIYYSFRMEPFSSSIFHNKSYHSDGNFAANEIERMSFWFLGLCNGEVLPFVV